MAKSIVNHGEKTKQQLISSTVGYPYLRRELPTGVSYKTYRDIRKDPTVALGRRLVTSAVLAGSWSVECDDDIPNGIVRFIKENFVPIREQVMESAVKASIDFGWVGFEKVFEVKEGRITLKKLKPLLHDITEIMIWPETGAFAGFRQQDGKGGYVYLPVPKCLHIGFEVEGTQWYGYPLLENVRAIHDKWEAADAGAAQYDKRVAGSHFVVYYPIGQNTYNGRNNVDNGEIASEMLSALEASGSISIPVKVSGLVDDLNLQQLGWKIDILEDSGGRQPTFVDRLKYLDALKCRGLYIPERAIIEGEFGTKAEAGEHANAAITNIQILEQHITRHVNWHCVNQLLAVNFGESYRGKVRLSGAPMSEWQRLLFQSIYTAFLTNPQGFIEESGNIDTDSIKDKLGIPKAKEVAQAGEEGSGGQAKPGLTSEERGVINQFTSAMKWS